MTFFKTARHAAAMEYGRVRAEAYGRRRRVGAVLACLAGAILLMGIVVAAHGGFGG